MSQNVTPFHWSAKTERAAVLLAEDALNAADIAKECGITERTLFRWKKHPAFTARVAEHVTAQREALKAEGIANRQNRVDAQNARWLALQQVIAERAEAARAEAQARERTWEKRAPGTPATDDEDIDLAPGAFTGLLVRQERNIGGGHYGHDIVEWVLDDALLRELRAHEEQAAKELGQWEERTHETVGADADFLAALRSFGADDGRRGGSAPDPKPA